MNSVTQSLTRFLSGELALVTRPDDELDYLASDLGNPAVLRLRHPRSLPLAGISLFANMELLLDLAYMFRRSSYTSVARDAFD